MDSYFAGFKKRLTAKINSKISEKMRGLATAGFAMEKPADQIGIEYMLRVGEIRGLDCIEGLMEEVIDELDGRERTD